MHVLESYPRRALGLALLALVLALAAVVMASAAPELGWLDVSLGGGASSTLDAPAAPAPGEGGEAGWLGNPLASPLAPLTSAAR